MRYIKHWQSCFFFLLFIYGCKSATDSNNSAYIEKFPKTIFCGDKDTLPISVLDPTGIMLSDSLLCLIFQSKSAKYALEVFRRKDYKHIVGLLTKGRGPNEITNLRRINQWDISEGKMNLLIRSYPYFMAWLDVNRSVDSNKAIFTKEFDFTTDYEMKVRIAESSFIFDLNNDKLIIARSTNSLTESDNPNPYFVNFDLNKSVVTDSIFMQNFVRTSNFNSLVYDGTVAISPDLQKFAISNSYLNSIFFFDLTKKTKKTIKLSKEAGDYTKAVSNMRTYLGGASSTKDYFFVLSYPEYSSSIGINTIIYTFKQDGSPLIEFSFKEKLRYYFVDQNSGEIFAIDTDEKIWRYKLDKNIFF
ncbi:MAG: hypothetical protein Q8S04_08545 [Bacteroidales bacterium]|nr:hypothetical protein [Bacteroidales bacterium]